MKITMFIFLLLASLGALAQPVASEAQYLGPLNILRNPGAEQGKTGWSNTGGTFTIATHSTVTQSNRSHFQFVATTSGEYFESVLTAIPDTLGFSGCQAQIDRYATADTASWKVSVLDSSSNVLFTTSLASTNGASTFSSSQVLPFLCPASGSTVRVRVESLAAGTIKTDFMYLGGNRNVALVNCQGTLACENNFAANIASSGDVTDNTFGWLSSCSTTATTISCTYSAELSASLTLPLACTANAAGSSGGSNVRITPVGTTTGFTFTTPAGGNTNGTSVICNKTGIDAQRAKPVVTQTSEQSDWFIDANIGGANVSLGTSSVSSYTGLENAGLDLVVNTSKGSASAEIGCSLTNAPTGTTCAVGSESVSVAWTPPFTGLFDVCFNTTWRGDVSGAGSNISAFFQVVETPINAQTILAEGGQRTGAVVSTTSPTIAGGSQVNTCGTFRVSDTAKKMHRLFYEQVVASPTSSSLLADRGGAAGQQDIRVTIRPSTMNVARSILTGDTLTIPGTTKPIHFSWEGSSSGAINKQVGDMVISGSGSSTYTYNIDSTRVLTAPICVANAITPSLNATTRENYCVAVGSTTSTVTVACIRNGGGAVAVASAHTVSCDANGL